MTVEIIEWIKDTSIIWIKNKGKGTPLSQWKTSPTVIRDKKIEKLEAENRLLRK